MSTPIRIVELLDHESLKDGLRVRFVYWSIKYNEWRDESQCEVDRVGPNANDVALYNSASDCYYFSYDKPHLIFRLENGEILIKRYRFNR